MSDLVEFLRARLAEDEEAARLAEAVDPSPWYEDVSDGSYTRQREGIDGIGLVRAADNVGLWDREDSAALSMAGVTATHAVRHDPARVLREVEAKRLLLEDHPILPETYPRPVVGGKEVGGPYYPFGCGNCHAEADTGEVNGFGYCLIWTSGALPYADHPNYRPEWAPTP